MRQVSISFSLAVVVTLSAFHALGQNRVTIDEAVRSSLDANPTVAAASARLRGARAAVEEAEAARQPRVSLSASLFQYEDPMVVTPIHGFGTGQFPEFDDTLIQSALNFEYLLWDGGARSARIGASESQAGVADLTVRSVREALMLRTAAVYLGALSRESVITSLDARAAALDAEERRVRALIDVGRAAEVDRLRIQAAIASAEAEREAVESDLRASLLELGRLIDQAEVPSVVDVTLSGDALSDRKELENRLLENNPRVRRAREIVGSRIAERKIARATYLPQVQAAGSWLQFGDDSLSFDHEWNLGLRVRVPLWDGGATAARVAQATAAVLAAEEDVRVEEDLALDHLDRSVAAVERNRAVEQSLEVAVDRFEEVVRIENLRLRTGAGTQREYLDAEADLFEAKAGLANARYNTILSRIELAHVLGELTPQWFSTHLRSQS